MQDMDAIYKKYSEIVYKYVFCLTGNEDTAEEIVQETFFVAVKDIHKFRGECKIDLEIKYIFTSHHFGHFFLVLDSVNISTLLKTRPF